MRSARILPSRTVRVWIVTAVLVATSLVLATGGCGGTQDVTTTAPPATQAPATTATSGSAATTAPPTTASQPDSTATTAAPPTTAASESTTTVASGPTTTEALSSAETRQADGTIKGLGYIDKVWVKDGVRYLSIDYAQLYFGQEAVDAAVEDGYIKKGESLDNDYYIRNQNPKKREFTVSADVTIKTQTRAGGFDQPTTWEGFLSFWGPNLPEDDAHLKDSPWWIVRNGNEVIDINEQYLP